MAILIHEHYNDTTRKEYNDAVENGEVSEELQKKYPDGKFYFFTTKGRSRHSDARFQDGDFLVFGKETKGLPEELLMQYPDRCVRLPMMGEARSLNLSNTVAIATYEVLRQWNFPELQNFGQLHNYRWEDV